MAGRRLFSSTNNTTGGTLKTNTTTGGDGAGGGGTNTNTTNATTTTNGHSRRMMTGKGAGGSGGTNRRGSSVHSGTTTGQQQPKRFHPNLITAQIIAFQCWQYLAQSILFQLNALLSGSSSSSSGDTVLSIDRLFTDKYIHLWNRQGWPDCMAIFLAALVGYVEPMGRNRFFVGLLVCRQVHMHSTDVHTVVFLIISHHGHFVFSIFFWLDSFGFRFHFTTTTHPNPQIISINDYCGKIENVFRFLCHVFYSPFGNIVLL
jgi:hypothetical protein